MTIEPTTTEPVTNPAPENTITPGAEPPAAADAAADLKTLPYPDFENAEVMGQIYKALGVPEAKDGYALELPEGGNEAYFNSALETFHKSNLTPAQAKTLIEWNQAQAQQFAEQQIAEWTQQKDQLKQAWGASFDANMELSRRGLSQSGLSEAQVEAVQRAIGYDGVLKLFNAFGQSTREANFNAAGSKGQPNAEDLNKSLWEKMKETTDPKKKQELLDQMKY